MAQWKREIFSASFYCNTQTYSQSCV